jgi:deoxyadenosine/deoxycytidine kinase
MSNIIVIDGNIGSGKTTVIRSLKDIHPCIEEAVDEWAPYLEQFYKDMNKNSLLFQMKVLQHHMKNRENTFKIVERSPVSCIHIFGQNLLDNNQLSNLDMKLMIDMNKDFGWYPKNIIYINTPPSVCYERIHERSRENEIIPLSYLESISKLYDNLYIHKYMNIDFNIPNIHIVDGTQNKDDLLNNIKSIINNIK